MKLKGETNMPQETLEIFELSIMVEEVLEVIEETLPIIEPMKEGGN